jgi:hypothetical protein
VIRTEVESEAAIAESEAAIAESEAAIAESEAVGEGERSSVGVGAMEEEGSVTIENDTGAIIS